MDLNDHPPPEQVVLALQAIPDLNFLPMEIHEEELESDNDSSSNDSPNHNVPQEEENSEQPAVAQPACPNENNQQTDNSSCRCTGMGFP